MQRYKIRIYEQIQRKTFGNISFLYIFKYFILNTEELNAKCNFDY